MFLVQVGFLFRQQFTTSASRSSGKIIIIYISVISGPELAEEMTSLNVKLDHFALFPRLPLNRFRFLHFRSILRLIDQTIPARLLLASMF